MKKVIFLFLSIFTSIVFAENENSTYRNGFIFLCNESMSAHPNRNAINSICSCLWRHIDMNYPSIYKVLNDETEKMYFYETIGEYTDFCVKSHI